LWCGASSRWIGVTPEPQQRIYCANHASHLDALVIWAALPPNLRRTTRPVAAADYWRGGVKQWLATRVFRAILIERGKRDGDAEARRVAAREAVEQTRREMGSDSLILFPEGTRSPTGEMGPFKAGVFHLVQSCPEVEIVPTYLHNLGRVLPRGEFAPVPLLASVTFGAPLRLEPDEDRDVFLDRLRTTIEELSRA
jgi:1-acyl-sn-glycerol-3-phosphate acyltransferase